MSEPQDQDQAQLYQQIIEKCWTDEDFKQQLLAEPMATLKAEGLDLPEDLSVKVLENTKEVFYMVIPSNPFELNFEELTLAVGGLLPQAQAPGLYVRALNPFLTGIILKPPVVKPNLPT